MKLSCFVLYVILRSYSSVVLHGGVEGCPHKVLMQ